MLAVDGGVPCIKCRMQRLKDGAVMTFPPGKFRLSAEFASTFSLDERDGDGDTSTGSDRPESTTPRFGAHHTLQ